MAVRPFGRLQGFFIYATSHLLVDQGVRRTGLRGHLYYIPRILMISTGLGKGTLGIP